MPLVKGDGRRQRLASAPWQSGAGSCPDPAGSPRRERDPRCRLPSGVAGLRLPSFSFSDVLGTPRPSKGTHHRPDSSAPARPSCPERGGHCPARAIPARGAPARSCLVPVFGRPRGSGWSRWLGTGVRRDAGCGAPCRGAWVTSDPRSRVYLMRLQFYRFPHPRDGAVPGVADAGSQGSLT